MSGAPASITHTLLLERLPAVAAPMPYARPPLWMAVGFPDLALETGARDVRLAAISCDSRRGLVVYSAAQAAQAHGIRPGMPLTAAFALVPELRVHPRDPASEFTALKHLAGMLSRFSPVLSLVEPDAVLLEVGGSLRLFGGLDELGRQITAALTAHGHRHVMAVTPTPGASLLLAQNQYAEVITDISSLRTALGRLPITVLPLETLLKRRLSGIGVRTLYDLWRLPRAGLARRFGPELVACIDRILGRQPEPQRRYSPPEHFAAAVELSAETFEHAVLVEAARHLLERLDRFLRQRVGMLSELQFSLFHSHAAPPTLLTVRMRRHTRDVARMLRLFAERLRHIPLPAAVIKVGVSSGALHAMPGQTDHLFPAGEDAEEDWSSILEEIEARLGHAALTQLYLCDDHRPERAWSHQPSAATVGGQPVCQRPLWLLDTPRRLSYCRGRLWYASDLCITSGPERIESGWWDGQTCRRDYYHATNERGSRLWVFHDLIRRQWYLHGLFG